VVPNLRFIGLCDHSTLRCVRLCLTTPYKHPLLTYKQTMAAFDGMLMLGYIEVTKEGYFGRPPISFFPTFAVDFRCKLLKYRGLMSKLCRTSTISSIFLLLRVLNLLGPSTTLVNMSDFYTQLYYGP